MEENAKPSTGTGFSSGPTLPPASICRATPSGRNFARCEGEAPSQCDYAIQFALHWYCTHPRQDQIVARTIAQAKSATDPPRIST